MYSFSPFYFLKAGVLRNLFLKEWQLFRAKLRPNALLWSVSENKYKIAVFALSTCCCIFCRSLGWLRLTLGPQLHTACGALLCSLLSSSPNTNPLGYGHTAWKLLQEQLSASPTLQVAMFGDYFVCHVDAPMTAHTAGIKTNVCDPI